MYPKRKQKKFICTLKGSKKLRRKKAVDNLKNKYEVKFSKSIIYKSNTLIEGSYYLSLNEQRLIWLGARKLKPIFINSNLTPEEMRKMIMVNMFDLIEINVFEFKKAFNIKSNNLYEDLSKITNKLYNRSVILYDENDNLIKKRWVITCKYDENRKSVFLQFHPDLIMELLVFSKKFTPLEFDISSHIRSTYTYRIYELLKQYANLGKRLFSFEELRYILAIEDKCYSRYSSFKQKILNPSIKLINKSSDITVDFEEIKVKRAVEKLVFTIKVKEKALASGEQIEQIKICETDMTSQELSAFYTLKDLFKNISITPYEANRIFDAALSGIDTFDLDMSCFDYIKYEKKVIDNWSEGKVIDNYVGALINGLKQNWKLNKKESSFTNIESNLTVEKLKEYESKLLQQQFNYACEE